MNIEELIENFEFLDDWEERYKYIIDLGKNLKSLDDVFKTEDNRVKGCTSQVWLVSKEKEGSGENTILEFEADSDAHIVRGLVSILLTVFSQKTAKEILAIDEEDIFLKLGLDSHLSPSRRNGLVSMVERIKSFAKQHM